MTDMTRQEMEVRFAARDARLDASEARTETRFVELTGKLDRLADDLRQFKVELLQDLRDVKADNKNTRWTIAATTIAALAAGVGAIWAVQNGLLSAFQAGLAKQAASSQAVAPPSTAASSIPARPERKASLVDAR